MAIDFINNIRHDFLCEVVCVQRPALAHLKHLLDSERVFIFWNILLEDLLKRLGRVGRELALKRLRRLRRLRQLSGWRASKATLYHMTGAKMHGR